MRDTTVARNYAEALFDLGEKHGVHDAFAESVGMLAELLESDRRIRQFLEMPKIDATAKKRVLREALAGKVPPLFLNFVLVVIGNRRQRLLREIGHQYRALLDAKHGRLHVQVTLAHPADAATEQKIAAELGRILGREVIPHISIDESILGGIVVRYGDQVMDGSVQRRLLSLRNRLMNAALPATALQS